MNTAYRNTLFACALAAPVLLLSGAVSAQPANEPERAQTFSGTLQPLNDSGVTGTFTIEQKGQGQIRVHIQATGLEVTPQPHVAHIHGLEGNADATCPTIAVDAVANGGDGDGFIELLEGLTTYGPIIVPLGDVDPNNDGVVNYSMTFNLNKDSTYNANKDKGDLLPLHLREIVLHGMTLQEGQGSNGGEADGTAGYKVVLPIACGAIMKDDRRNPLEFRTP